jgi:hypothetical protein
MAVGTQDDVALLRRQQKFLHEVEQTIRAANRELIHARIPELNGESFARFAHLVARLRAEYLHAAFEVSRTEETGAEAVNRFARLREHREAFEEARSAFEALQRAIERGYVDIEAHGLDS